MQNDEPTVHMSRPLSVLLVLSVGVLASLAGALVALLVPDSRSGWIGVALIPFWLLVEVLLEVLVAIGSLPGKPSRVVVGAVVLAGFYAGVLLVPVVTA